MNDILRPDSEPHPNFGNTFALLLSWLWVGLPLAWGIAATLRTSMALFR